MNQTPLQNNGRIALVTGATGGIGYDLAECFARDGYDLVLVARRAHELTTIAERFSQQYRVRVETIVVDLSETNAAVRVMAELEQRGITVDVLVNNAGYAQFGAFVETDLDAELRMMQLNMVTLTHLTKLLLPEMIAHGWGKILNVASTAAFMPGPLMAVYYATKAYVLSFSEALGEELRDTGVTVTALCPGPTQTGFQARAQMQDSKLVRGRAIMNSAAVAREGYLALMAGKPLVIPGFKNKLQAVAPRFMPRRIVPATVRRAQSRTGSH